MGALIRIALLGAAIYLLGRLIRRLIHGPVAPKSSLHTVSGAVLLPDSPVRRIRGRGRMIVAATLALLCTLLLPWGGAGGGQAFKVPLVFCPLVMLPWAYPVIRAWQGYPMRRWLALACCALALLWGLFLLLLGAMGNSSADQPHSMWASIPFLACAFAFWRSVTLYIRDQSR